MVLHQSVDKWNGRSARNLLEMVHSCTSLGFLFLFMPCSQKHGEYDCEKVSVFKFVPKSEAPWDINIALPRFWLCPFPTLGLFAFDFKS